MLQSQKMMSKQRKPLLTFFCLLLLVLTLTACGNGTTREQSTDGGSSVEHIDINTMVLKGPSAVAAVKMMNDSAAAEASDYHFQMVGAPDEVVSAVSNGSADIAVVPTNLAAALYNKTKGDIKMVAATTLGSLYLVESGQTIQDMSDLQGKTICTAGQGANPQFILEHLLTQSGLTIGEDVFIEYRVEQSEVVAQFIAGKADFVLLPEPFTSLALSKSSEARVALDFNGVWKNETGNDFAMSCVIARTSFINDHPELLKTFLSDLRASVAYTRDDVETTAELCVKYEIIINAELAQKAIPQCKIVYKEGSEMEPLLAEYFRVLQATNPASVGGEIPDKGLYYLD